MTVPRRAALFLLAAACSTKAVPRTVSDDPSLPSLEVNHVRLHLQTVGDPANPTVLVVHGGPGGDFRSLWPLAALADRYEVVFYDQRGGGLSERVSEDRLRLADLYAELDALVDHFGRGRRVNLIGHSFGAMLASGYLGQHPEKIDHLVLAEPGMLTVEAGRRMMAATNHMRPAWSLMVLWAGARAFVDALSVVGPDAEARRDYLGLALMTSRVPGHPLAGYFCGRDLANARMEMWRFGARASAALLREGFGEDGEPKVEFVAGVERFPRKVLFLAGSCSSVLGESQQRRHMSHFPKAELEVIAGAGHTMFGEKPVESLLAVRRYLDAPN